MAKWCYYNDNDRYCCDWIGELIGAGLLPDGEIDDRSIRDVAPEDLKGFRQVHLFAGLGGWAYALRLAGWPDDGPVIWTGSCPCQPFSVAGKGLGEADPRHLWPDFFRLVQAGRPSVLMGEQVSGKAGYVWFDGVASDLEREDYACWAVDIPAAAVNAPHIRQRLYWVADTGRVGSADWRDARNVAGAARALEVEAQERQRVRNAAVNGGPVGYVADTTVVREREQDDTTGAIARERPRPIAGGRGPGLGDLDDSSGSRLGQAGRDTLEALRDETRREQPERRGGDGSGLADTDDALGRPGQPGRHDDDGAASRRHQGDGDTSERGAGGFWNNCVLLGPDREGKWRRVKSGVAPVAARVPETMAVLRAAGNSICAPLAAEVVRAYMETRSC